MKKSFPVVALIIMISLKSHDVKRLFLYKCFKMYQDKITQKSRQGILDSSLHLESILDLHLHTFVPAIATRMRIH